MYYDNLVHNFFFDDAIVFILVDSYIDGDCDKLDIFINSGKKCVGGVRNFE